MKTNRYVSSKHDASEERMRAYIISALHWKSSLLKHMRENKVKQSNIVTSSNFLIVSISTLSLNAVHLLKYRI